MELQTKTITTIALIIVILAAIAIFFVNMLYTTAEAESRSIFSQGCLKYCKEINQQNKTAEAAVSIAEALEGTDFIKACKSLYDVKYNWQCWNRNCCEFSI
ncbi:MAG: hypothetical protein HZB65_00285 [Candidatus Aenigmarchaeota archaeon]|nr:hypothetical protein [Candidatus Aenigmarchaeota archaeon]